MTTVFLLSIDSFFPISLWLVITFRRRALIFLILFANFLKVVAIRRVWSLAPISRDPFLLMIFASIVLLETTLVLVCFTQGLLAGLVRLFVVGWAFGLFLVGTPATMVLNRRFRLLLAKRLIVFLFMTILAYTFLVLFGVDFLGFIWFFITVRGSFFFIRWVVILLHVELAFLLLDCATHRIFFFLHLLHFALDNPWCFIDVITMLRRSLLWCLSILFIKCFFIWVAHPLVGYARPLAHGAPHLTFPLLIGCPLFLSEYIHGLPLLWEPLLLGSWVRWPLLKDWVVKNGVILVIFVVAEHARKVVSL